MISVDYYIGEEAEFLNAFSALERLVDQEPSVKESYIAKQYGPIAELFIVVLANITAGSILTVSIKMFTRHEAE